MTYGDIEKEYSTYMEVASLQLGYSDVPQFVDVGDYLSLARNKISKMAIEKMPYQVFALDRAIEVLMMLTEMFHVPNKDPRRLALYAQLRRSSNITVAFREVMSLGLEESARVLTRNLLESNELAFSVLVNAEFSARYFLNESVDQKTFWKQEIAYGKIYQYVSTAYSLAVPEHEVQDYLAHRKELKNITSSAVHCDDSGGFRGIATPVLGEDDLVSIYPYEASSAHAPNHIEAVIDEVYMVIGIFMNAMQAKEYNQPFALGSHDPKSIHSFLCTIDAFQKLVNRPR
ncbi:TPA: hypothetical protein NKX25_002864 [Vibrio parahaemolyticus]|uniref:hypothetical protein n=1 Tax=Vibrio parahaemolyticus TaxID=670 RepID=UPI000449A2AB|nr:hypothetical protein [Vibrio parahaemolyticus]EXJ26046.1 hypothetical protein D050_4696 [Vibrio parahaemolyticus VPCR-2009]HCH4679867.1 hypothetical protein [Vibrio parahaemolyticus]